MILLSAFVFGITLAIAIGPIALLIIRYAATQGLSAGLASACGAALADFTYAVFTLSVGAGLAPFIKTYTTPVHVIAAFTLICFGGWMIWTAIRPRAAHVSADTVVPIGISHGKTASLLTTYTLTVSNPLTVIAFLAFIAQLPPAVSALTRTLAAIGLFIGSLIVQVAFALGGTVLGRLLVGGKGIFTLNLVSGVGVVLFGVVGLAAGV